jgi:ABC-type transport system involved in multi-copper enzyme maturation permease subunit
MSALVKKEIRLLLPAWIAAILPAVILDLGWLADLVSGDSSSYAGLFSFYFPVIFSIGILLLGISSFGHELNSGTFTILLSQPIDRQRVWRVKITALLLAFVSVCLAAIVIVSSQFYIFQWAVRDPAELASHETGALKFLALSSFVMFSGGLWTTLLLRHTTGAFWFTLIIPLAIVLGIETLLNFFPVSDQAVDTVTMIILFAYAAAGFLFARRLFFNVQDLPGSGQEITFLWRKEKSEAGAAALSREPRAWTSALVGKEIQLHQINFLIAVVVLALHLLSLLVRKIHPHFDNQNIRFVLETVWALWLLMPLLIGCAAVAEECKLGMIESQLCQPVSRRAQFAIKFFVALFLSMVLGAVIPSVIEYTSNFGETDWFHFWIFYAAAALFFVSLYASTLTRSTLLAMGVAIAVPVLVGPITALIFEWLFDNPWQNIPYYETTGHVICLIYSGVPVLVLVLTGLMFWNFKWLHQNLKLWRRNAVILLLSFVFIYFLCNAIFFRAWEWLSPIDTPHGPARLSANAPVKLFSNWGNITIALSDGRLWNETIFDQEITLGRSLDWDIVLPNLLSQRYFVGSSNWLAVAPSYSLVLGIQSDGSLWAMPQEFRGSLKMRRLGTDTDWAAAASGYNAFLLLKKDGSLWVWGTNDSRTYSGRIKNALTTPPTRLGTDTDWTDVFPTTYFWAMAKKSDGTLWNWLSGRNGANYSPHLVQNTNFNDEWISYSYNYQWSAAVSTNHELWFFNHQISRWDWDDGIPGYATSVKLDAHPVWKAVAFSSSGSLILLRTDGTLWESKFLNSQKENQGSFIMEPFHPIRLGQNSDWIALLPGMQTGLAMAADGSLWSWGQMSDRVWLAPSRKPIYMGNIFEGATAGSGER